MGTSIITSFIVAMSLTTSLNANTLQNDKKEMEIKKMEDKTINNQLAIKKAIERYIVNKGEYPKNFDNLKEQGLFKDYHENNLLGGLYSFIINEANGTLTIYIELEDKENSYFKNSIKSSDTPICVDLVNGNCKDNFYKTTYPLPISNAIFDEFGGIKGDENGIN